MIQIHAHQMRAPAIHVDSITCRSIRRAAVPWSAMVWAYVRDAMMMRSATMAMNAHETNVRQAFARFQI